MVKIKFTSFGANSAFGGFAPGDTMRCGAGLADHLVNELRVAVYADVDQGAAPAPALVSAPVQVPAATPAQRARKVK